jgi:hypothetical protein
VRGPIKEKSSGRIQAIYAGDDLEDSDIGEFENFATKAPEDESNDALNLRDEAPDEKDPGSEEKE